MKFPDVKVFEPSAFMDDRGVLYTVFQQRDHSLLFVQDKVSISKKNVLRGLHGDAKSWKLCTCVSGELFFVVVDARPESKTYLEWDATYLSSKNRACVLIPPMFANGHLILSDEATFFYKWSYAGEYPDVGQQFTLKWDDERLGITWPLDGEPILSPRDR